MRLLLPAPVIFSSSGACYAVKFTVAASKDFARYAHRPGRIPQLLMRRHMELGATSAEPFDDAQQGQYNTLDLSGADVCRVIL